MAAGALPIIDLTGLASGSAAALARVAAAIGQAAREVGFFYVTAHDIDPALTAAVLAAARQFFALPQEAKAALSIERSRHNRGYVALGGEQLDPARPADLKEAFNIGLDLAPDDPRVVAGEPFRGVNLWPPIPGWRETMLDYFTAAWRLGRVLHRAIASDLGTSADFFEDKLDQPLAVLRILRYPPQPETPGGGAIGAGAHTDYGNLTLLLTDGGGGLEVRRRNGTWLSAPSVDGAFICNIGDCLMRWTNDVYVSTPHRVVNARAQDRLSVAFFLDPNPDALVACLPGCAGPGRPPRYPAVTGAAYLQQRLDDTYAFRRPAVAQP